MANIASAAAASGEPAALTYVYAVLPAGSRAAASLAAGSIAGIGGAPVRAIEQDSLLAVVGDVPAAEFEEAPLNRLMRDLAWLGPRAAAHQAVNAHLSALADSLLPLAFGAIYRSEESARAFLRLRHDELVARLAAVRGRAEWVLTLRRDDAAARAALERESDSLRALAQDIAASPPGRAYLLRRREAEVVRQEGERFDRLAAEAVVSLVEALGGQAYPERVASESEGAMAGPAGHLLLRLSALVDQNEAATLAAAVARFDRTWSPRGYSLAATGPWPPYRFGALGAASDGEAARSDQGAARGR